MRIDKDKYVLENSVDKTYLTHEKYVNDSVNNFRIQYRSKPYANIDNATLFDTTEDAEEMLNNDRRWNLRKEEYKAMLVKDIFEREHKRASDEADAMIHEAWENTSEEEKEKILDQKRKAGGEEAVKAWLEQVKKGGK